MTSPLVSVLVTTYNHAEYLEQALDSVLAQDSTDYELIITDDCSQDDSAAVIRAWLERTGAVADFAVNERNLGICATRNRALARSSGRFVCSLSGDDWYEPDRVSRQASFFLDQDDDVAAVYSDVRVVAADGAVLSESYLGEPLRSQGVPDGWVFERLHRACFPPAMGVMVRRSAIDAVGGYDEELAFEDWDMWLRLADRYRFRFLDRIVANRRVLPTSLFHAGFGTARLQKSVIRVHEKWLYRDEVARAQSARAIRQASLIVAGDDRQAARAALRQVSTVPARDRVAWNALEVALAVPGSGRLVRSTRRLSAGARALSEAELGAWRSGRRLPRRRSGR